MYTDDVDVDWADDPITGAEFNGSEMTADLPFLPLTGVVAPSSLPEPEVPEVLLVPLCDKLDGIINGSSNCPAGVRRRAPSGLNVNLLKKLVKLSSPYSLTLAQCCD